MIMTKKALMDLAKRVAKTAAVAAAAVYSPSLVAATGSGSLDDLVNLSLAGKAAVVGLATGGTALLALLGTQRGDVETAELFEKKK